MPFCGDLIAVYKERLGLVHWYCQLDLGCVLASEQVAYDFEKVIV